MITPIIISDIGDNNERELKRVAAEEYYSDCRAYSCGKGELVLRGRGWGKAEERGKKFTTTNTYYRTFSIPNSSPNNINNKT